MDVKFKVSIIVSIQIVLIITSFLTLQILETQALNVGDAINVSGLNRFLSSNVIVEVNQHIGFERLDSDPIAATDELKKNIYFLKDGGIRKNLKLNPLPEEFKNSWNELEKNFLGFEKKIIIIMALDDPKMISYSAIQEAEESAAELVQVSDKLTNELTLYLYEINFILITLQGILLLVNTGAHIFLVWLIFAIFKKESEERVKTERLLTIGKLGSSLAHDLRNPLAVIKGSVELLKLKKDNQTDDFQKKQYEKIENAIERIQHQTKDVLNFVRSVPLKKTQFRINEVLKIACNDLKIPEEIKVQIPDKDYEIFADKNQLLVVFSNLIHNSIQALDGLKGSISIMVEEKPDWLKIKFEDSGPGFEKIGVDAIFEPLVTTKNTGTGLGLISCKRIIEEHGGKISAQKNPTTFTIELPR